jgi:hypothetical protein
MTDTNTSNTSNTSNPNTLADLVMMALQAGEPISSAELTILLGGGTDTKSVYFKAFQAEVRATCASLVTLGVVKQVGAKRGAKYQAQTETVVNPNLMAVLDLLDSTPIALTRAQIADHLKMDPDLVRECLQALTLEGSVVMNGRTKGASYHTASAPAASAPVAPAAEVASDPTMEALIADMVTELAS